MSASFSALAPSAIVHCSGISGLTMRQPSVVECRVWGAAGKPFSGFCRTQGARLIDSTPPATTTAASPASIARAAWIEASRLEPQSRLTVTPGTLVGRPASSTAIRATSRLSSPAPLASPRITSSICSPSNSGTRSSSARSEWAARSSGRIPARAPP